MKFRNKDSQSILNILVTLVFSLSSCWGYAAEPIELIVTEQKTVVELEAQRFKAEQDIYNLYSKLNTDNYYDIECKKIKQTGTIISEIRCEPNFLGNLILLYGASDGKQPLWNVPENVLREHNKTLQDNLVKLTNENPELNDLVARHTRIMEALNAAKLQQNN